MDRKITSFFISLLNLLNNYKLIFLTPVILGYLLIYPNITTKNSQIDLVSAKKIDEILVKFKNNKEIYKIKIAQSNDLAKILKSYNLSQAVEYAEPNYLYQAAIIPSDTYYTNQWYLKKIKAPAAWDEVRESPNLVIAIIDTGVQIDHPDLKDNIWFNKGEIPNNRIDDDNNGFIDDIHGWDFVNNEAGPEPKFTDDFNQDGILHGTIVAGIAAAAGNNATGITGITWRVQIMPLKVLDDKGEGNSNNVIKAIDYAIANGADIINFSFVGQGFSQSLESAIRRAYKMGIIIVAAAGNEQADGEGYFLDEVPMYPVCHDGENGENMVIGVAATDALDQKAPFSSYGFKCIDISAPGVSIFSTVVYSPNYYIEGSPFNKYYDGYWSGTSMAAPMVSSAIALIEATNPKLTRDKVVEILINQADNINRLNPEYLGRLGMGRLNLYKSVLAAKSSLIEKTAKLVIAPGEGKASQIKITDKNGNLNKEFLAYGENFRGGVNVAAGDVDGDGIEEIITGAGFSGGPHVRIFNTQGDLISQFFAYDEKFRGGVNVAAGDVDGDGIEEIITGAGFSGGPQVRIFRLNGKVMSQFFAYDEKFRGGVRVVTADIDRGARGHQAKIITAPGRGGGPHIRIFNNHAQVLGQFFAYHDKFRGGVNISSGDVDSDGIDEIITGAGPGGAPHVRVFKKDGTVIGSFYAFPESFSGGVSVGAVAY